MGRQRTHPRYPEEWIVSARILAPNNVHGGMTEVSVHYAMSVRDTYEAAISDAASQALSVLCFHLGAALDNSVWRHFPRRAEGDMRSAIVGVQNFLNTRMVAQVGLTAVLHTQMERTSEELQGIRHRLADARRENDTLRAQLQGRDPPDHEDDDYIALSPPGKRTLALSTPLPLCYLRRIPKLVVYV